MKNTFYKSRLSDEMSKDQIKFYNISIQRHLNLNKLMKESFCEFEKPINKFNENITKC